MPSFFLHKLVVFATSFYYVEVVWYACQSKSMNTVSVC